MPDPTMFKKRQEAAAERKAARENASSPEWRHILALEQIAEALFSLRDETQDLRIAAETIIRK